MFSNGGNDGSVLLILLGLAVAFELLARRVHVAYPVLLVGTFLILNFQFLITTESPYTYFGFVA
jgi:hypothetical protein